MRLEEALQALRVGKSIRRRSWWPEMVVHPKEIYWQPPEYRNTLMTAIDLAANDWEVVDADDLVADFLCKNDQKAESSSFIKKQFVFGKQPLNAVLVPESIRKKVT